MKATQLLRKDHETVTSLFDEAEQAGASPRQKRTIFEAIRREIDIHSQVSEEIFYPAIERASEEEEELVEQALKDHDELKGLLGEIEALDPDETEFDFKMTLLRETFEQHVDIEETEVFDAAQTAMSEDELEDVGTEMEELKENLMTAASSSLDDSEPDEEIEQDEDERFT